MKKLFLLLFGAIVSIGSAFTQDGASQPVVMHAVYFDVSPPLRDMVQDASARVDNSWKDYTVKNKTNAYTNDLDAANQFIPDAIRQTFFGASVTDTTIQNLREHRQMGIILLIRMAM